VYEKQHNSKRSFQIVKYIKCQLSAGEFDVVLKRTLPVLILLLYTHSIFDLHHSITEIKTHLL